jgi:hypothetical protein
MNTKKLYYSDENVNKVTTKTTEVFPMLFGGGQERGVRAGLKSIIIIFLN